VTGRQASGCAAERAQPTEGDGFALATRGVSQQGHPVVWLSSRTGPRPITSLLADGCRAIIWRCGGNFHVNFHRSFLRLQLFQTVPVQCCIMKFCYYCYKIEVCMEK